MELGEHGAWGAWVADSTWAPLALVFLEIFLPRFWCFWAEMP